MKILKLGVYLAVFCLPLYLIKFSVFGLPFNVLEAIILALFLAWLIKNKVNSIGELFKKGRTIIWPIILILFGAILATIFSWDLRLSLGILKGWFVIPFLFFAVLITTINQEEIKKVLNAFVFSGFTVSVISLIYLILGKLDVHGRLQGIYNSPNYLAMYLAPCLLMVITFLLIKIQPHKDTRQRPSEALRSVSASPLTMRLGLREVFLVIEFLIILVVLIFTKSYGAWIGLIAAIFFLLFLKANKYFKFILILLAVISVVVLITSLVGSRGASYNARWVIWDKALEVFRQYPLFGIGPGTFEYYFPPYPKWGVPQPHSIYFAFLLQTGIIGFVGFIWLLILFFKRGFKTLVTNHWLLITIIMSVMVYILVHGLVDTLYWKNDLSVFFWIIIGLMVILSRPKSRPGSGQESGEK